MPLPLYVCLSYFSTVLHCIMDTVHVLTTMLYDCVLIAGVVLWCVCTST